MIQPCPVWLEQTVEIVLPDSACWCVIELHAGFRCCQRNFQKCQFQGPTKAFDFQKNMRTADASPLLTGHVENTIWCKANTPETVFIRKINKAALPPN